MAAGYHLLIKLGDSNFVPISNTNLKELTIVQDINKFLPSFRLKLVDNTGVLTHILPFDKNLNTINIELAKGPQEIDDRNNFIFKVYRRTPESDQNTPAAIYNVSGLLDINNLFSPDYTRGFSGNLRTSLAIIGAELEGINTYSISPSLDYSKNIVQPTWTNAQLFKFLKEQLVGGSGEYGYKCYISTYKMANTFNFKSLSEMIEAPVKYKFILSGSPSEGRYPIFNYSMFDNYKIYGVFASRYQNYSYFDYDTSEYINNSETVMDYNSLSDYYLMDQEDAPENDHGNKMQDTGRSNDFTSDFKGYVKGSYGNRLINLVKMWITTEGLPNIIPGEIISIFFPHGVSTDNLYAYQYSGYWLVEKVVHNCGDTFYTKLLLTRHGLDTDKGTSLLQATNKKKS